MIHVLALAYTYYLSDPRVMREAEAIARRGDEIELFCLRKPGEEPSETIHHVRIRHLPVERYRGDNPIAYIVSYGWFFIVSFFAVSLARLRKRYDIIHIHTMPDFLVFAALIPRLLGAKIVLDMHDFMPETFGAKFASGGWLWRLIVLIERFSTHFADHIITVHDPYVKLIHSRGVPEEKLTAILNLPDQAIFYPQPFCRDQIFTITYFGTLAERHGIDVLLQALAILKKDEDVRIRFVLIGEGDVVPKIKQMATELQLGETLQLIDHFVKVWELPDFILKTHLGVIPYRSDSATRYMLPVKLLEYVFMNVPVIASKLDTIRAYFDEEMIFFVPAEEPQSLANAVRKMYHSEQLRDQFVANARRFTELYNWSKESQKLYSVYDRLIHQ